MEFRCVNKARFEESAAAGRYRADPLRDDARLVPNLLGLDVPLRRRSFDLRVRDLQREHRKQKRGDRAAAQESAREPARLIAMGPEK
jgi:hypothetical protein